MYIEPAFSLKSPPPAGFRVHGVPPTTGGPLFWSTFVQAYGFPQVFVVGITA